MSTLADLIAVAVENARLYRTAQELAALEERNRLARELHDSVSQALYGIALGARTAQKLLERDPTKLAEPLDYVLSLAEAGLSEMRALIFELRPELLENDGLQAALAAQVTSMQARHQIEVDAELCDEPDVSIAMKEALYRIAREALHNTVKHARASRAKVRMDCLPDGIVLELADNGVGFDPSGAFPGHLGLKSMRERAQAVGASFTLESAPGEGTRIVVEVHV
jgi:signal transduction histidine kinase